MLKIGIVGLGSMGRGHLSQIVRLMKEGMDIKLVALCDINPDVFKSCESTLNLSGVDGGDYNFSDYHIYTKVDEMLEKEQLDVVNVVVPTYEHFNVACKVLRKGVHCLCEKPMALSLEQCRIMIETAKENNVQLMIGQCLRFWGEYVALKEIVDKGTFGKPLSGRFYRGGGLPESDWYLDRMKGGGALFDQHIHDVDMVNYIFGMPIAVCSRGVTAVPGSGYDIVTTNYIYEENNSVTTQNDWFNADPAFNMTFAVNFEGGTVYLDHKGFRAVRRSTGEKLEIKLAGAGHYGEFKYFYNLIMNGTPNTINPPEDSMNTIKLALAEMESCDLGGDIVYLD